MIKGKKKSSSKKGGKVVLSPFVIRMLKRLAACSSKESIRAAMETYNYLEPDRRRFV